MAAMEEVKDISDPSVPLDEWILRVKAVQKQESIWVESSETVSKGFMSKPYVVYTINLKRAGESTSVLVKHRFSEFEQLVTLLKNRYIGMAIPALPDKSVTNIAQSESYVSSRQSGLNFFCQSVMRNPFLRNDKYWLDFLTPGVKLISTNDTEDLAIEGNLGLARWLALIEQTPEIDGEKDGAASRCAEIEKEAKQFESVMRELGKLATEMKRLVASQSRVMQRWQGVCEDWHGVESTSGELNGTADYSTDAPANLSDRVPEAHAPMALAQQLAIMANGWHQVLTQLPGAYQHLQAALYDFLANGALELCSMVKLRVKYRKEFEEAIARVSSAQGMKPSPKRDKELEIWQAKHVERRTQLDNFTKMFLQVSLPMVVDERSFMIRQVTGWKANMTEITGSSLGEFGSAYFHTIPGASDWSRNQSINGLQGSLKAVGEKPFFVFKARQDTEVEDVAAAETAALGEEANPFARVSYKSSEEGGAEQAPELEAKPEEVPDEPKDVQDAAEAAVVEPDAEGEATPDAEKPEPTVEAATEGEEGGGDGVFI